MIVHDPRLNNPTTPTPTPLRPPAARNVWTVTTTETASHIIDWAGTVGRGASGGWDALHFMAHGNRAYLQIGGEGFSWANVSLFDRLRGAYRCIVFFGCLVGSDESSQYGHPPIFALEVARRTGAKVVAARENQVYSWNTSTSTIDFGNWEGEVYVFAAGGGSWQVYNSYNPFRAQPTIDLETLIFGG